MIGIFLDDERTPSRVSWIDYPEDITWKTVRTFEDFKSAVKDCWDEPYEVSFDHDIQDYNLNGDEVTGYTALKWLVDYIIEYNFPLPEAVYFHTKNPVGKRNMESYWSNFLDNLEDLL